MNGFKKLVIDNFQSHKHTEIELTDGLNVFVGPSDSGKSAILRALKWVLFNIPRGTDFIRTGTRECRVCLILNDGTEVTRIRSSSVNRYVLRTADGNEQIFEGFGNTVPEEITRLHQIVPVRLDQKELILHFGSQLESPFLLFESNQNKAKTIGRISGAHLIDNALKKTSSDRLALGGEIKQLEKERAKLEGKLKPYDNLEELETSYLIAEQAFHEVQQKEQLKEHLKKVLKYLEKICREKKLLLEKIASFEHLPQSEQEVLHLEYKKTLLHQFERFRDRWQQLQQEKQLKQDLVKRCRHLPEAEKSLAALVENKNRLLQFIQLKKQWRINKNKITQLYQVLVRLKQVPEAVEEYERIEEKADRLRVIQPLVRRREQNIRALNNWRGIEKKSQQTLKVLEEIVPKLTEKVSCMQKLVSLQTMLLDKTRRIETGRNFIKEREQEIYRYAKELYHLLKQRGKCPTCGMPISHSVLEHIMEEYQGGMFRAAAGREDQAD
ncbi:AAA family ATPase [Thermoactinomyces mirandus]|uniref:Nuclease SbcCD subunit C n=1 Tax=Thermoactinomyces mirandus TaxID=2756294 RepID=A0A7W2ASS8_9BACL|nr:AAA family ATPase [Thermoactinomyces mirandus]MBA4603727.1 AAA family ATPase [Thermoactinomyces mirandus]